MRRLAPVLIAGLVCGCSEPQPPRRLDVAEAPGPAARDSTRGVRVYEPARAWKGVTLDLYRRQTPILFDMNGRVVHSWPRVRVRARARLLADGSLLAIARGKGVVEYDWDGRLVWDYAPPGALTHHDVVRLTNGNTLLVVRPERSGYDSLLEVDRERRVVWEWRSQEHLGDLGAAAARRGDVTHVNSVQELPPNPWFARGDRRFRPGNLLVSARNLNAVFVVDREDGEIVWSFTEKLDLQHEALMIGPGMAGHGNLLILSNGSRGTYEYRRSAVLEVDPAAGSIVWEFKADGFFTPTGGVEQPLPNGHVLVTSTRGGRTFETTRAGEIVWEWVPPFGPARSSRYAYDHCPQLAARRPPVERPVRPAAGYRHVDPPLYRFAPRGAQRTLRLGDRKLAVLERNRDCRRLLLPAAATLDVDYGLDAARIRDAGRERHAARFTMRLEPAGSGEPVELLAETLDLDEPVRHARVSLELWAYRWVDLCVEAEEFGYWTNPAISTAADAGLPEGEDTGDLTAEERAVRRAHLRALGYVD